MKGFMPTSDKFQTKWRYEPYPLKEKIYIMKVTITIGLKKMNWVKTLCSKNKATYHCGEVFKCLFKWKLCADAT